MTKNKLIDEMVSDLKPVSVLWSPEKRTLIWLFAQTFLSLLLMAIFFPLKLNLSDFSDPRFFLQYLLFFSSSFLAGYFSFLSVIPGRYSPRRNKILYALLMLLFISLLIGNGIEARLHRPHCQTEIIVYSLASFALTILFLRKGFLSSRTYLLNVLAVSLLPAALMHLTCSVQIPHMLQYHLAPVLLLGLLTKTLSFFLRK